MPNPIEDGRKVNPNLLTGGSRQGVQKGIQQTFPGLSQHDIEVGVRTGLITDGPGELVRTADARARNRQDRRVKPEMLDPNFYNLEQLFPQDERIRVDTDGTIHIEVYPTIKQDGKNKQIRSSRKYQDLESAIRSCFYVVAKHRSEGETTTNLRNVLNLAHDLYTAFTNGEITEENLEEYVTQTYTTLEENHLLKPRSKNRKAAVNQILNAFKKDRIGKNNPLISRTLPGSAAIKLVEELLKTGFIEKKYTTFATLFMLERETERGYLEKVLQKSKEFLSKKALNRKGGKTKAVELRQIFNTHLHPEVIKVNPYSKTALMSLIYLYGFPEDPTIEAYYREFLTQNFTPETPQMIDHIHDQEKKGSLESFRKFKERLGHVIQIIEETLDQGDTQLPSSFFEQFDQQTPADSQGIV
ncbi:MAG: hypothetical protein ABH812_00885 [bacterium]